MLEELQTFTSTWGSESSNFCIIQDMQLVCLKILNSLSRWWLLLMNLNSRFALFYIICDASTFSMHKYLSRSVTFTSCKTMGNVYLKLVKTVPPLLLLHFSTLLRVWPYDPWYKCYVALMAELLVLENQCCYYAEGHLQWLQGAACIAHTTSNQNLGGSLRTNLVVLCLHVYESTYSKVTKSMPCTTGHFWKWKLPTPSILTLVGRGGGVDKRRGCYHWRANCLKKHSSSCVWCTHTSFEKTVF